MIKKQFITKDQSDRLYNLSVPVIGLTGGIATGKSTVSSKLREEGHPVICADSLVKEVYKSPETIDHLKDNYPNILNNQEVDFKELRKAFFSDEKTQKDIEQLIYKQLPSMFLKFYEELKASAEVSYIVYDVPLLFEKGLDKLVDQKFVVYCPREQQIQRLINRDHIDKELAEKILLKQMPIEEKKELADFIIDNSKSRPDLTHFKNLFN